MPHPLPQIVCKFPRSSLPASWRQVLHRSALAGHCRAGWRGDNVEMSHNIVSQYSAFPTITPLVPKLGSQHCDFIVLSRRRYWLYRLSIVASNTAVSSSLRRDSGRPVACRRIAEEADFVSRVSGDCRQSCCHRQRALCHRARAPAPQTTATVARI